MSANRSQAYQLKAIRFQSTARNILLQNENGPCPLLAAANALLLRGVITLDPVCVRNGVASTDDVVNMLANRALVAGNQAKANQMVSGDNSHHTEYHLNEVLSLLPNLQHGMDVNPKFTFGPTGVEYTKELAAFDLLGVELVHGWILDPQDTETVLVVGSKTYNELIETVIHGNEAKDSLQKLEDQLCEKEKILEEESVTVCQENEAGDNHIESESIDASGIGGEDSAQNNTNQEQTSGDLPAKGSLPGIPDQKGVKNESVSNTEQSHKLSTGDKKVALKKEIINTRENISELSLQITISEVANGFLTSSGHQLTYLGLEQLHEHMGNDALCVFFRNNHFATLTKRDGVLYLLVTDLGYANTPEIVWERLDNIDGDTSYANEFFAKPTPRAELKPAAGPTIAPELLLAQRGQAETDYQLALAMSKGAANPPIMANNEDRLIRAAKELSLKSYHGDRDAVINVSANNDTSTGNSQIDSDLEVAMAYQRAQERSEHESEQLARQLQELEYARQRPAANPRQPARVKPSAQTSNCTIS